MFTTVASSYLRFYIEAGFGVSTFLRTPTPTPPKILSDSDPTALAVYSAPMPSPIKKQIHIIHLY
jgi:hypothetical protein